MNSAKILLAISKIHDKHAVLKIGKIFVVVSIILVLIISFVVADAPENQLHLSGFDPKIIDVNSFSGVELSNDSLTLMALPNSSPFMTSITTSASFDVEFSVTVERQSDKAMPVQIGIWDPRSLDTFSVWFSSPGNVINYGARKSEDVWEKIGELGRYRIGLPYSFRISFVRRSHFFLEVSNSSWSNSVKIEKVTILDDPMVDLSFFATDFVGTSVAIFEGYHVILPTQPYYNYLSGRLRSYFTPLYALLLFLIVLLWNDMFRKTLKNILSFVEKTIKDARQDVSNFSSLLSVILVAMTVQLLLTLTGSHPYDIFTMKVWAYLTNHYGLVSLYPGSVLVPSGQSVGGISTINSVFPYPPLPGYFSLLTGCIYGATTVNFNFNSYYLDFLIKVPLILTVNFTGVLIYIFIKRATSSNRKALILMSLYVFNPGVVLEAAVWGQFSSVLTLFLMLSVLSIESDLPDLSWVFMALCLLTKATSVFGVAFLSIVALKRFGFRKTVQGVSSAIILSFIIIAPYLFSGYSPQFLSNVTIGNNVFNVIRERPEGILDWQTVVSSSAYNIWPLVTYFVNGQSRWGRFAYPDFLPDQAFGVSYVRLGTYLSIVSFILILFFFLLLESVRRAQTGYNDYKLFFLGYLAMFALYMFNTRMHERHLVYVFPLILMSYTWIKSDKVFAFVYGSLMFTFFLSMYATLALTALWLPSSLPAFRPNANPLNWIAIQFIANDSLLTFLSILNLGIFIFSLMFVFVRSWKTQISKTSSL